MFNFVTENPPIISMLDGPGKGCSTALKAYNASAEKFKSDNMKLEQCRYNNEWAGN